MERKYDLLIGDRRAGKTSLLTYFGIINALTTESDISSESYIPSKCLNYPCLREYPFCAACLVDIGGDND